MHILQSWKESLSLFKPSNFKLFFLVSAQAFGQAVKTMFLYWGWFILLFWTYDFLLPQAHVQHSLMIDILFRSVLLFLIIASLRPSASIKNLTYFARLFAKVWYIVPITIALYWLNVQLPSINSFWDTSFFLLFSLVLTLYLLFVTDSGGGASSLFLSGYRAVKMLLFNAPWFIIIAMAFTILELLSLSIAMYIAQFSDIAATIVHDITQGALYGFQVTMIVNFYIKRLYEQLEVYFALP